MKIISVLTTLLFILIFTSCRKTYTCTCTKTLAGQTTAIVSSITDTKKNAESKCSSNAIAISYQGISIVDTCKIN